MQNPPKNMGTLKTRPLAEILVGVHQDRYTGALVLAHAEIKKSFYFESGKLVQVRSNMPSESFLSLLLTQKKITHADLQKANLEGKEAHQQSEELVRAGLMTPQAMLDFMQHQMQKRVLEVFQWEDGKFALVPQAPDGLKVPMSQSLLSLIFQGLLTQYGNEKKPMSLTGEETTRAKSDQKIDPQVLSLDANAVAMARSVGGQATLAMTARAQGVPLRHACAVMLAFRDLGYLEIVAPKAKEETPVKVASVAEVQKRFQSVRSLDYFDVLEVSKKASEQEVKQAYFELAKRFHPDRISAPALEKKVVEDHFSLISMAHNTLSNPSLRKDYEAGLQIEASGISQEVAEKILQSEMIFQKALLLLKKGLYKDTADEIGKAIVMYDQEPEYHMIAGWASFRDAQMKKNLTMVKKYRDQISKAMEKNPRLTQGYYYLGMIDKSESKMDSAKKNFERMLEAQPGHPEAALELRSIQMKEDKKENKGLMGMFGKKK